MNYCDKCHIIFTEARCPNCNSKKIRTVLDEDYCYVIEKNLLWAKIIQEAFEKNNIPFIVSPVYGAALSLKIGPYLESYRFFVPYKYIDKASTLIAQMFKDTD